METGGGGGACAHVDSQGLLVTKLSSQCLVKRKQSPSDTLEVCVRAVVFRDHTALTFDFMIGFLKDIVRRSVMPPVSRSKPVV